MSTHNILKQSLRHLSVSIHYLWGGVGWVGGRFGGIAGGNGREISSCQQIVNSPTEKKNRTKQKKLKRVKGKKITLIISFKVMDSYTESFRSPFVSFFFWKFASTHPGWKGRCECKVCCRRIEFNGLATAEPRTFYPERQTVHYWYEISTLSGWLLSWIICSTNGGFVRAQWQILDSKMKSQHHSIPGEH